GGPLPLSEVSQPRLLLLVAQVKGGQLAFDRVDRRARGDALLLETLGPEPEPLLLVIDGPDLTRLDAANLGSQPGRLRHAVPHLGPRRIGSRRHDALTVAHLAQGTDQQPPLRSLHDRDITGVVGPRDSLLV